MTRDEIMNMPAGREMDALIAEKLLGWTPTTDGWFMVPKEQFPKYWKENEMENMPNLYSTDIAAAWEVVEKLEEHPKEILFSIVRKGNTHDRLRWCATFRECLGFQKYFYIEAETAPLAICRAALLTVSNG